MKKPSIIARLDGFYWRMMWATRGGYREVLVGPYPSVDAVLCVLCAS